MRRYFLAGLEGDVINVVLAAAGANRRKLLRRLRLALRVWLLHLLNRTEPARLKPATA